MPFKRILHCNGHILDKYDKFPGMNYRRKVSAIQLTKRRFLLVQETDNIEIFAACFLNNIKKY